MYQSPLSTGVCSPQQWFLFVPVPTQQWCLFPSAVVFFRTIPTQVVLARTSGVCSCTSPHTRGYQRETNKLSWSGGLLGRTSYSIPSTPYWVYEDKPNPNSYEWGHRKSSLSLSLSARFSDRPFTAGDFDFEEREWHRGVEVCGG